MKKLLYPVALLLCITTALIPAVSIPAFAGTPVENESLLRNALAAPGTTEILINSPVEVENDLTIPEGKTLRLSGSAAALAVNGTLTNEGKLILEEGAIIDSLDCFAVNKEQGTIEIASNARLLGLSENLGIITVSSRGMLASGQGTNIQNRGTIAVNAGEDIYLNDAGRLCSWMGGRFVNSEGGVLNMNGNYLLECNPSDGEDACYFIDDGGMITGNGTLFIASRTPLSGEAVAETVKSELSAAFPDCRVLFGAPIFGAEELYEVLGAESYEWSAYRLMGEFSINQTCKDFTCDLYIDEYSSLTIVGGDDPSIPGSNVEFSPAGAFENYGGFTVDHNAWANRISYNAETAGIGVGPGGTLIFGSDGHFENYGQIIIDNGGYAEIAANTEFNNNGSTVIEFGGTLRSMAEACLTIKPGTDTSPLSESSSSRTAGALCARRARYLLWAADIPAI